jgi:hypothetical protein
VHVNGQIGRACRDQLTAGQALPVDLNPVWAFSTSQLPRIAVDVLAARPAGQATGATGGARLHSRVIEVSVSILVALDGDVSAQLDEHAVAVEACLGTGLAGVKLQDWQWAGETSSSELQSADKGLIAARTIKYAATVALREGKADTSILRS